MTTTSLTRRIILAAAMTALPLAAIAQDDGEDYSMTADSKHSVATASFFSHWFAEAAIDGVSFYGDRLNTPATTKLPSGITHTFRTNASLSLALGKWFTPGLALRTRWQGPWGRSVVSADKEKNSMRYWTLSEQVLFNVSNMFYGYSDTRTWSVIPYLSASIARNMNHDTYALGLGIGLTSQWRITPKAAVFADLSWHAFEPDFDAAGGAIASHGLHGKDQMVTLSIGVAYALGNPSFKRITDSNAMRMLTESQIEALNAQLADEQAENARLRKIIEEKEKAAKEPKQQ